MKILFVLPRMWAGGVERVTLNLAAAFRQEGIACRLVLRHGQGEFFAEAREIFSEVDIIADDGMRHFVPRLAALIRVWQPTHIITAFTDVGLLTWLARWRADVPARLIHGLHNTHVVANRRPGLQGLLRYAADGVMARFLYPRVDALVCVSKGIEAEVMDCCPAAAKHTHTIYNPVASAAFIAQCLQQTRRDPVSASGRWTIVGLGRLTPQKGFDVLIDAAAKLPTTPDWRIDLYGDGPQRADLQQRIVQNGLQSRITLHGYTDQSHAMLSAADIFVLPSRYEGFGLVIAEAMLHGVQIVAADCPHGPHGPHELLDAGRLGQLVPADEAAALAGALLAVMGRKFWIEPSELQRQAARFSTEASVAQWLAVLTRA